LTLTTGPLGVEGVMILAYDPTQLEADVESIRTMKRAEGLTGGLSKPGKMPCFSYNLPADTCGVGGMLRHRPGSTCYGCYAATTVDWQRQGGRMMVGPDGKLRGSRYATDSIVGALRRRHATLADPLWVPAMVVLIRGKGQPHFRWHDSGDVQSPEHLANIFAVCRATPAVRHWLPTQERRMVETARERFGPEPDNLTIRASAAMINGHKPRWPWVSTVTTGAVPAGGHPCPAPSQGNQCGECRACWSRDVPHVVYHIH
jgi:hypothetical protein